MYTLSAHPQAAFVGKGVIFQLQGEAFFSYSEWVVVTGISFGPIEYTLNKLHRWFTDLARKKEPQDDEGSARLRAKMVERAMDGLELLGIGVGAGGIRETKRVHRCGRHSTTLAICGSK